MSWASVKADTVQTLGQVQQLDKWKDKTPLIATADLSVTGSGYLISVGGWFPTSNGACTIVIDGETLLSSAVIASDESVHIPLMFRFNSSLAVTLTSGASLAKFIAYLLD